MKYLRTIATYVYLLFGTALAGLTAFLVAILGDRQGRLWWPTAQLWARGLLRTGWVSEIRAVNAERLAGLHAAIVMSNHESHFDPPALIATSRTPLRFLTKHTLFYFPIFGQAMWAMGYIFINRGNQEKAFRSVEKAAKAIRKGRSVLIFPEGTRSRTEEMLPFKKGGFVIATKSQVPIIPVGIAGTRNVLPKGFHWLAPGPIALVVGELIDTQPYSLEQKEALMAKVREEIERLRAQARKILEDPARA